jgi:ABC-type glycerol-3-phosphate transport system substrate-binding protein
MKSEREYIMQDRLLNQLRRGQISRRRFMQTMMLAGMGLSGVRALGASPFRQEGRPLTPTFYQWIYNNHPEVNTLNQNYPNLDAQIAPVEGFDVARFVAEGQNQESTWDVYVGMTPFVEMAALIAADVIEPWDNYISQDVLDDIIPSIREECTVDGKLYSWPFLLDVIVSGSNSSITNAAGLPEALPTTWDEYLANSQTVVESGAARYGCTFDAHGWRSLAPFTHSLSTDAYYNLEGDPVPLFDFTSEPALAALELMKQQLDLSSANALQPGATDGGVNQTPDEVAFGAQQVAYYTKYQNAHLRFAGTWTDPAALRLGALPKFADGEGSTVFWTTGACLFKYGQNKEAAAEYMQALTYEPTIWRNSIVGTAEAVPGGQIPPFASIYDDWAANPPDWFESAAWLQLVRAQLDVAKAIPNHAFGLQQFVIGQPEWERYLTGEEPDPMVAMQAAKDAVVAAIETSA